jgi:hypothetical protein
MPKWLKQWIIWNAPENRIQRGSKARLFDILWKMWWSSRVTITMQSFLHPCPYAWTTVGTRCKLGPQSWTGMTRCKSTHVRGFFFIKHLSISQHVLKSFDMYLISILLGTSVPNCLANHNSSGNYHNT